MTDRDPLLQPRAGDVVGHRVPLSEYSNLGKDTRTVLYLTDLFGVTILEPVASAPYRIFYSTPKLTERVCTLATWRDWSRGAEVVETAPSK